MYQPPFEQPFFTPSPEQVARQQMKRDANFVGFVLLALMAAQLLLSIVLSALQVFGMISLSGMDNTSYMFFNMLTYLLYLAAPALLVALITRRRQNPFPTRRVSIGNYVVALFGGMMLAVAANYVTSYLMMLLESVGIPYPEIPQNQSGTPTSLVLNLISTAILPALLEEMVMRGYVLGALRPYGDKLAVVLSAALFGLIHGNVLQLPFAFMLGLALGWLVVQTDCIWPAVLLHFGNNAMSVLLDYVELAVGDNATATALTFLILAVVGTATLMAAFLSNKKRSGDLLRPIGNGAGLIPVSQRVKGILTAPAMIVGVGVWCVILIRSMLS